VSNQGNQVSAEGLAAILARTPKLLVVDDEYIVRLLFDRLAGKYELDITSVSSPEEGLRALEKSEYDVIFLDMKFPQAMGGMDMLRTINRQNYTGQIVVMSGSINLHDVMQESNKLGVVSFMIKPVDFGEETLLMVLKRSRIRLVPRKPNSLP